MSGDAAIRSLATTVATPAKKCGRKSLSSPRLGPPTATLVACPSGYISRAVGAKTNSARPTRFLFREQAETGAVDHMAVMGLHRRDDFGSRRQDVLRLAGIGLELGQRQRLVGIGADLDGPIASRRGRDRLQIAFAGVLPQGR